MHGLLTKLRCEYLDDVANVCGNRLRETQKID